MTVKSKETIHLTGEHPLGDAGQVILFILFMLIWIYDSFVLHFSTVLSASVPLYIRLPLALIVIAFSVWLVMRGHVLIEKKQDVPHVMNTGAFSLVRHPIYSGFMFFYKGLAISTFSLVSFAFMFPIFVFYNYIAAYEERLLEKRFGSEYTEYKKSVPRWIPALSWELLLPGVKKPIK